MMNVKKACEGMAWDRRVRVGRALLVCCMVAALAGAAGCRPKGQGVSPQNGRGSSFISLDASEEALVVVPPADFILYPVLNDSFELWKNGLPQEWHPRPNFGYAVAQCHETSEGHSAVKFIEGQYYNYLEQAHQMDPDLIAGKKIQMTALACARDPNQVGLALMVENFGSAFHSDRHPGDGKWHLLKVSCRVPAFWTGGVVRLRVTVGSMPQYPVYFDKVQLAIE